MAQICAIGIYSRRLTCYSGIRSTKQCHYGEAHDQVVRRMGDHAGNQAPCPFIDPCPEESAPKNAEESNRAIAVGQSKDTSADQGGRKKCEPAAKHREQ